MCRDSHSNPPHRCRRLRRTGAAWAVAAILSALLFGAVGCMHPAVKQVKRPRRGRPLNARVCLVYSKHYQISMGGLEKLHPFDINKYERIYVQLVRDGLLCPHQVFVPEVIGRADLRRVHTADYLDRELRSPTRLASYLELGALGIVPAGLTDRSMLQAFRVATGGTLKAARLALEHGMAINLGGGYHHAEPDTGGGFCIYADMPVAIRALQAEGLIDRALIIDVDAHQGNGTAVCLASDDVFTFDMFQEDIYPIPKERNDVDVPLPAGTGDTEYLEILDRHLPDVFEQARPDIVFVQAGVDSLGGDPLAALDLTISGIVERDRRIFAAAARRGVPVVMTLGAGCSRLAWRAQYESIARLLEQYGASPQEAPCPQCRARKNKKGR